MKCNLPDSLRIAKQLCVAIALVMCLSAVVAAQSPRVLYTWDGGPSIEDWIRSFGTNSATLNNSTPGSLTIIETGVGGAIGSDVAISDGFNRIVESSTGSGGLDLTGLDYLEFDLGHNGSGPVNVQFYVQASINSNYLALGTDISVLPGMNTYQVPLPVMTYAQQAYIRTVGFNARSHNSLGNLTWSLNEVRSGGTPLIHRELVNHNIGSTENGLQGAIANFDLAAIQGNNGGQNQTGLVHNPSGPGSLQWIDLGGSNGGAVTWANGTAWDPDGPGGNPGNSFNERMIDLSNYQKVTFRVKATDPLGQGGNVNFQPFFQFVAAPTFQSPGLTSLPIDGQWHVLTYPLSGITGLSVTSWTGINLGSHPNTFVFDVDYIRFSVPEPGSVMLAGLSAVGLLFARRFA